jgi:hypothetical protein
MKNGSTNAILQIDLSLLIGRVILNQCRIRDKACFSAFFRRFPPA